MQANAAREASIAKLDEVIEVRRMFGLPDYFVRVATADVESYEEFVSTRLTAVPGVARIDSHLTMKTVKSPEGPNRPGPRTPPSFLQRSQAGGRL